MQTCERKFRTNNETNINCKLLIEVTLTHGYNLSIYHHTKPYLNDIIKLIAYVLMKLFF